MFLDIRDFTKFADSRAPSEVANFQNIVFGALIKIVRSHQGIVNQVLGDGIMAVFGAPLENETHVTDAVNAGLAMIEKTGQLANDGLIPSIRVGIGIHTGKVIAGEVGNEYRKFYSLAGTNVIIAARIEQLNKEYKSQLLISDDVKQRLDDGMYQVTFLEKKILKGISDPVGIYQLA